VWNYIFKCLHNNYILKKYLWNKTRVQSSGVVGLSPCLDPLVLKCVVLKVNCVKQWPHDRLHWSVFKVWPTWTKQTIIIIRVLVTYMNSGIDYILVVWQHLNVCRCISLLVVSRSSEYWTQRWKNGGTYKIKRESGGHCKIIAAPLVQRVKLIAQEWFGLLIFSSMCVIFW